MTSSRTLVQPAGGRFDGKSGRCLVGELFVVRDGSEATSTPASSSEDGARGARGKSSPLMLAVILPGLELPHITSLQSSLAGGKYL